MKWVDGVCELSDDMEAVVFYHDDDDEWKVRITGLLFTGSWSRETESLAKESVADWVRKTITQLGNALVQGHEYQDDGA